MALRWIWHGPLAAQAAELAPHCCGLAGSNVQVLRLSTDGLVLLPFCFQFAFRNDCASVVAVPEFGSFCAPASSAKSTAAWRRRF